MEITKKDILKLIEIEEKDSFINHFLNILKRDCRGKGEIKNNEIRVWNQNRWVGITYPIFRLKLNSKNNLIDITSKVNSVGQFFYIGFVCFLLYIFIFYNFNTFNFREDWRVILVVAIYMSIFFFVTIKLYHFEKKQQLQQIFEILEIEVEDEKPEKEWSLKNIFIRLFTYPFCFFLIGLNLFFLIPDGNYILAIGSFLVIGYYLIADIKMIFREKSNKNIK